MTGRSLGDYCWNISPIPRDGKGVGRLFTIDSDNRGNPLLFQAEGEFRGHNTKSWRPSHRAASTWELAAPRDRTK